MIDQIIGSEGNALKTLGPLDGRGTNLSAREILSRMRKRTFAEVVGKAIFECLRIPEDSGDEGAQAWEEYSRDLSLLLTARDKQKLQAIEEAWEKMEKGTYGICEECEDPIGGGRLKVMPLARLWLTCQSKLEKEQKTLQQPEEYLFLDEQGGAFP